MTRTEAERIASLEAKMDVLTLDMQVVKTDVRQLLVRDIERAVVGKYVGRLSKLVPWGALATALAALFAK